MIRTEYDHRGLPYFVFTADGPFFCPKPEEPKPMPDLPRAFTKTATPEPPPKEVTLVMTERQAIVLRDLFMSIGGSPSSSVRMETEALGRVLRQAGVGCRDGSLFGGTVVARQYTE
jgi:hypothetical protein